jgi:putative tricarboxylic transport membrane protein
MSEGPKGPEAGRAAFHQKSAEIAVAALFFLAGAILIKDSVLLGFGWQEVHGPQPGYFPFYVGLIICISSVINFVRALVVLRGAKNKIFVERDQLKLVLTVLVPTAIYAGAVTWIGIYTSSVLFIAFFMRWLGKYPWWKVAAVSVAAVVVFFLIFEVWFKVPLPKGPIEAWLGF